MKKIRIIVAGSRTLTNHRLVEDFLLNFAMNIGVKLSEVVIVSGGAKGVDSLGEAIARRHGIELKIFNANWNKYGKSAGPIRNKDMAEYSTHLLLIWDGKSKGSANMKKQAERFNLPISEVVLR